MRLILFAWYIVGALLFGVGTGLVMRSLQVGVGATVALLGVDWFVNATILTYKYRGDR